jgi:hypothetical protein
MGEETFSYVTHKRLQIISLILYLFLNILCL